MTIEYYILSAKWTRQSKGNTAIFWRTNGCGYSINVTDAGVYGELEAMEVCEPSGGEAIMLRKDDVDAASVPMLPTFAMESMLDDLGVKL